MFKPNMYIFFPDPFWCKFEMSYEYVFLWQNIAKASYTVLEVTLTEGNYVMYIQGVVTDN